MPIWSLLMHAHDLLLSHPSIDQLSPWDFLRLVAFIEGSSGIRMALSP
jgi:hypothetical protein